MISKTVFFTKEGKAVVREIDVPHPKPGEVQVKSIVNGICMFEVWKYKTGNFDEASVPGHEGMGIVTEVGKDVKWAKEGDYVTVSPWSEYVNVTQSGTVKLTCTPQQTKNHIVEPLSCAVNAFSHVPLYPGNSAILFGAGYMGLLLLQLLAHYPLKKLVIADIKQQNLQLAKAYGADETIDLSTEEGKARLDELVSTPFDISYECSGSKDALDWCTKLTKRAGALGIYAWHHESRLVDANAWHIKGLQIMNVSPFITMNERPFRSFEAADSLMTKGVVNQEKLITHRYHIDDIERGMQESLLRADGFVKSIIEF